MVIFHAHRTSNLLSTRVSATMIDGYWRSQTATPAPSFEPNGAYGAHETTSRASSVTRAASDDLEHRTRNSRPVTPAHNTEYCAICQGWTPSTSQERSPSMLSAETTRGSGADAASGPSTGSSTSPRTPRDRGRRPGYWPRRRREAAPSPTRRGGRAASPDRCLRCRGTECLKPGRDCYAVSEGLQSYGDDTW